MKNNVSSTTQNRLIISGLLLSTILIISIALFAVFNIQKQLNEGYQNFGQIISRTLAIESIEITKNVPSDKIRTTLEEHAEAIFKTNNDIVLIEFRNQTGDLLYSGRQSHPISGDKPSITITSPLVSSGTKSPIGSVTVGLSGNIISRISTTTRKALFFVFTVAWLVFALVILVNTYLITRELRILQGGVKKISTGEFGYKISAKDVSSEVRELFDAFNDMSNRLHLYEEQNIDRIMLERNKFESVLMSIANGVVVCDNDDNVVLVNEHAESLLKISEDELLNIKIQQYTDTSENECFKDKIEEFKDTPLEIIEKKPLEFKITVDDKVIKSIISPMFTRSREYAGYIIVLIDMTKEAEMDKMRAGFISNVSHELRTPVTVLRSYIDTLYNYGNEFDYETQKEFIGTINQEIIRLNRMVNDILDFSRIESNAELEKTLNDITKLVESCANQVEVLAKEKNLKIKVSKSEDIPEFMFNYDSIERAVTNLLSNAIKYSPDNAQIELKSEFNKENNSVIISVKDYGCGIAKEHQDKLFDRFYRVETSAHTIKGTGLGLNLVKTTIEKHHNGRVFVDSELGQGSTFGFELPAVTDVELVK